MSGKSARLKQVIIDRIRSGDFPVGHKLVGARTAAAEFGVHANTVTSVYRELADDGIVRTVHGSGTFVVAIPGPEHGANAIDALSASLTALAEQARRLGLTREGWEDLVSGSTQRTFLAADPVVWMVECSRKDVDELSHSLTSLLSRSVNPLLVTELPGMTGSFGPADIVLTTPFHYDEVAELLPPARPLLNVNVVPTSETLVRFAHLDPGVKVSVVASNQPTLDRLVRMVHTYTRITPCAAVLVDAPDAQDVVRSAEVLIDSQSIHDRVAAWQPPGHVCTVRYQIEPTSVAYVREVLRLMEADAVGAAD